MKRIAIASLIVLAFACEQNSILIKNSCPSCLQSIMTRENPPLQVWRYKYINQTVYLVIPDCCDQYEELYSTNCTLICAPGGGLTGKGDGQCTDFSQKATEGSLIWERN
jgi:hypothetical protein